MRAAFAPQTTKASSSMKTSRPGFTVVISAHTVFLAEEAFKEEIVTDHQELFTLFAS